MMHPPYLSSDPAIEDIVSVAGVAGFIARDAAILEVGCRQICRIIGIKASAVWLHDVAGEAEAGLFGALHVLCGSKYGGDEGKDKQCQKSEDLAGTSGGNSGRHYQYYDQDNCDPQQGKQQCNRHSLSSRE